VRRVNADGREGSNSASYGSDGLRPAINILGNTLVSDEPDADGAYTLTFAAPPVINYTGSADLGTVNEGKSVNYSVTSAQGNAVTVTERLDGHIMRTYMPELGAAQRVEALAPENYMTVLNGSHTLTIEATDGTADAGPVSVKFAKAVHACSVTLARPMPADDMPTQVRLQVSGNIPTDAILTAEVCNNAYDAAPAWEDISGHMQAGYNYPFAHTAKAAETWGVNFRVGIRRGPGGAEGYAHAIEGGYR
jgi:hypothetical protein